MKNLLLNEGYKIGDYYYGGNGSFIKDKKTYKPKKENEIKLKSYIEKIKNVVRFNI